MFVKSEAFYDAIYGTMKDYARDPQKLMGRGLYIGVRS